MAEQSEPMAYAAFDADNRCVAICTPNPEVVADHLPEWRREGLSIRYMPSEKAKQMFCDASHEPQAAP